MAAKIRGLAKQSLISQVREGREQYYQENYEEQKAPYDEACAEVEALDSTDPGHHDAVDKMNAAYEEWNEWFDENYPGRAKDRAAERKRMRKKSKRTARSRIEITDYDLLSDRVEESVVKVEWGDWLADGCLVQTRNGEIGMVVESHEIPGYRTADTAVRYGGRVQLMIDGQLRWRRKINLRPLED